MYRFAGIGTGQFQSSNDFDIGFVQQSLETSAVRRHKRKTL